MKSQLTLDAFVAFCKKNPDLRFWQALRAFVKCDAIFTWKQPTTDGCLVDYLRPFTQLGLEDTFYRDHL